MATATAIDWLERRFNLPTSGSGREIPPEVRRHAFFSTRVSEAHILERLRPISDAFSRGEIDEATAMAKMSAFLVSPEGGGLDASNPALSNLASTGRIKLILEQNASMAASVGQWERERDPDIADRWPCWRYVNGLKRKPRTSRMDHKRYHNMVFRKDDPIWSWLFPPRGFRCTCGVVQCDERQAARYGGVMDGSKIAPEHSPDGFEFNPADAFNFGPAKIAEPETRAIVVEQLEQRFPEMAEEPAALVETPEEHKAHRQAQWATAYDKRLVAWKQSLADQGMPQGGIDALAKCYSQEVAKHGAPPRVVLGTDVKKTYLSKDGAELVIRRGADLAEVEKALGDFGHKLERGKRYRIAQATRLEQERVLLGARKIQKPHSSEDDRRAVNPNFGQNGDQYTTNCQRCVSAYEARRRGLEVFAKPRILKYDPLMYQDFSDGWPSVYRNAKLESCASSSGLKTRDKVCAQMEKWGDGARAIVRVVWAPPQEVGTFLSRSSDTGKPYLSIRNALTAMMSLGILTKCENRKPSLCGLTI